MDTALADMSDRVVLLTGATSGIGRVAAERLAERGAELVLVGRDRERGRETLHEVRARGGDGIFVRTDLADPEAVRGLAREVESRYDRLDVLVNNAALSLPKREVLDYPGGRVEKVLAVNHLAPYLLTRELLDRLTESAPARVVTTSSGVQFRGDLELDDPALDGGYDALDAYARSKLANVVFTTELAARLPDGVTANAYHPGFVPGSGLYRDVSLPVRVGVGLARRLPFAGTSVADGGAGLAYLAASPDVADVSGEYFVRTERGDYDDRADDPALRRGLWEVSAALLGVDPDWP
ncbi:SDR family NAD(P)-dependent oxidoreductase [Halomarina litorea]|uniref:SDR family NAD(P)-dependent oxidoreductase n=1 Tax=Halomarina litorea TaxID=2961595 RepID=UPI0020C34132|nr:SDR family NAD(P)-dependent oxidoreductase [Halomarina sp. BCD28]